MAIAVPLFVGALNNAEETVKDANIRSVRSTAAASIVLNGTKLEDGGTSYKAVAYVNKTGTLSKVTITTDTSKEVPDDVCEKNPDTASGDYKDYKYKVTVYLTVDNLTA